MSIKILCLGPPQILLDGAPLPQNHDLRFRERALLFYLAAHEKPVPRSEVQRLFWGPVRRADTGQLSIPLSRLRKTLPEIAPPREHKTAFTLQAPPHLFIDCRVFQEAISRRLPVAQRTPLQQPLPHALVLSLARAAKLWRGSFLQGFLTRQARHRYPLFTQWVDETAADLQQKYFALTRRLAYHFWVDGDPEKARHFADQALGIHPADEGLNRLLAEAQKSKTSPKASSLQRAPFSSARPGAQAGANDTSPSIWNTRDVLQVPFIGRRHIINDLLQRIRRGRVVIILGESGQGKTRLLQQIEAAVASTYRVLRVGCRYGEREQPFAPLREALREQVQPDEWARVPSEWWPYLVHLLPEIRSYFPEKDIPPLPSPMQAQLVEAMRQVLLVLGEEEPLLLCIDDAQWSDSATLDALTTWADRPPFHLAPPWERRATMLFAARPAAHTPTPFHQRLPFFLEERRGYRFELKGLSQSEVKELAEPLLQRKLTPAEVEELWRASIQGTPLYLLEIIRYQLENHRAALPVEQWATPRAMTNLLKRRLRRLDKAAQRVLFFAALEDADVPWRALLMATQVDAEQLSPILAKLERAGWLTHFRDAPHGILRYGFTHDKLREIVAAQIDDVLRQHIHSRWALAWESALGPKAEQRAAAIARHYHAAGDPYRAFHWWVRAARYALKFGVAQQAHEAFSQAAGLIAEDPLRFPENEIWQMFSEWTLLAGDTVDISTLQRIASMLDRLATALNSPLLRSSSLNAKAHIAQLSNRMDKGAGYTAKAIHQLTLLRDEEDTALPLMEIYTHHAALLYMQGQIQESLSYLQKALTIGESRRAPFTNLFLGSTHYQLAVSYVLAVDPQRALHHADLSLQAYEASRRVFGLTDALGVRSLALFMLGRLEEARAEAEQACRRAEQLGKARMLSYIYSYYAFPLHALGRLEKAWEVTQKSLELQKNSGGVPLPGQALALRVRGDIFFLLEDWERALTCYQNSLKHGSRLVLGPDVLFRLAITVAQTGDLPRAQALFAQASEQQRASIATECPLMRLGRAELLYLQGRYADALQVVKEALADAQTRQRLEVVGGAYLQQCRIYLTLGEIEKAEEAARHLYELGRKIKYRWLWLRGLEMLQRLGVTTPAQHRQLHRFYRELADLANHPDLGPAVTRLLISRGWRLAA